MRWIALFVFAVTLLGADAGKTLVSETSYSLQMESSQIVPKMLPGRLRRECRKYKATDCTWMEVVFDGEEVARIDEYGNTKILNPDSVLKTLWWYAFGQVETKPKNELKIPPREFYPLDFGHSSGIKKVAWQSEPRIVAAPNVSTTNDVPTTTKPAEDLAAQLVAKDQQIAQLQRQLVLLQREGALHQQAYFGCLDQLEEKQKPQIPMPSKRTAPVSSPDGQNKKP